MTYTLGGAIVALSLSGAAFGTEPGFVPVEPGTADVSTLRADDTIQPQDFRDPLSFDTLYRINAGGGMPWGDTPMFARRHGAVTAVFPQSEYAVTRSGVYALVPAATEFYIGPLPFERPTMDRPGTRPGSSGAIAERAPDQRLPTRIDSRVDLSAAYQTSDSQSVTSGRDRYAVLLPQPTPMRARQDRAFVTRVLEEIEWLRSASVMEQAVRW